MKQFFFSSARATTRAGELFAEELRAIKPLSRALVIGLHGELGSGKTTFAQGFIKGCGIRERAASPTFVLFKKFSIPVRARMPFSFLYHFDCYRIQRPQEILLLGWKEIVANPSHIVLVEWPGRIASFMPRHTLKILFQHAGTTTRMLCV